MRKLVEKVRKSKNSNHFTQQRSHPWLAENQEAKEAQRGQRAFKI